MRYISELISDQRRHERLQNSVLLPDVNRIKSGNRVNLLALGDVGATVLMGLRLLGGGEVASKYATANAVGGNATANAVASAAPKYAEPLISEIGIYDINESVLRRYEMEINQTSYPVYPGGAGLNAGSATNAAVAANTITNQTVAQPPHRLPSVRILTEEELFDCDMFVFCASKGVPPVGASGDVRMLQLDANRTLIAEYAKQAAKVGFKGIFAVVSDPVDPLCKAALKGMVGEANGSLACVQGYGLGVMNARAMYYAAKPDKTENAKCAMYLNDGRVFGPHGQDLVVANSISQYDEEASLKLTEMTVAANLEVRAEGFKPYIAPAFSSGAIALTETLRGGWNYSSVYFGDSAEGEGAFLGCMNRRTAEGIEIENVPIDDALFARIKKAYDNLIALG